MKLAEIQDSLKSKGRRKSLYREEILRLFAGNDTPQAATDILAVIQRAGKNPNKTTIYRELDLLVEEGIIKPVNLLEGKHRYQLITDKHYHHLVCTNCKKIEQVELENDLDKVESKIAQSKHFKVQDHSLEFFGTCEDCQ